MYNRASKYRLPNNRHESPQRNMSARTVKRRLFQQPYKNSQNKFSQVVIICFGSAAALYWFTVIAHLTGLGQHKSMNEDSSPSANISTTLSIKDERLKSLPHDSFKCSFREYKPHRYYPVDDLSEPFLADAEYIRGRVPFIINPPESSSIPRKICTDTSEWEDVLPDHRPFSDGQNPSFVSLAKDAYGLKTSDKNNARIELDSIRPIVDLYGEENLDSLYLGLLLFGDSQCRWNMSADELEDNKFSPLQKAPSKRSLVMILNQNLEPIGRAILRLEHDADWGDKRKKYPKKSNAGGDGFESSIVELDDARLFFHGGRLHVLYRNGPSFGYEKQIQNPIHFEKVGDDQFTATIKASESFSVCCGRNIAFISEIPTGQSNTDASGLNALTWIDPVTTEVVEVKRRLTDIDDILGGRRRLSDKKKRSAIHGTNGYLVPLHSTNELLGVAHFHRPEHRDSSDYARHGHHYTHAFFTLKQDTSGSFHLSRLSNEFLFHAPSAKTKNTGDVIQFASGLDLVGSDTGGKVMISYGINDCEAAIVFLNIEKVQKMLFPVEDGTEVVSVMKKRQYS